MGVQTLSVSAQLVELKLEVAEQHLQPFGLVHGGVFSGLVETACSMGAVEAAVRGQAVVGVENQTSFLRPVKSGTLLTRAVPVHCGRQSQLWQADVLDEQQRLVATGRVRLRHRGARAVGVAGVDRRQARIDGLDLAGQPRAAEEGRQGR